MRAAVVAFALIACGHARGTTAIGASGTAIPMAHIRSAGDPLIAVLPDGAQVVVELDLDRLRANEIVGKLVREALAGDMVEPRMPAGVPRSPLGKSSVLVLAAYGVGTAQAATVIVLATKEDVANARRLTPDLVALGPPAWLDQLEARAAIKDATAPEALLALRDHAVPTGAPGAAIRVTARLPFDARIALARMTGLEAAPAQLSIWGDVADDLAIVIDADSADPGDKHPASATKALVAVVRGALASIAAEPALKVLGAAPSVADARIVVQKTWVRAIVAIGPDHLKRIVARAFPLLVEAPL